MFTATNAVYVYDEQHTPSKKPNAHKSEPRRARDRERASEKYAVAISYGLFVLFTIIALSFIENEDMDH